MCRFLSLYQSSATNVRGDFSDAFFLSGISQNATKQSMAMASGTTTTLTGPTSRLLHRSFVHLNHYHQQHQPRWTRLFTLRLPCPCPLTPRIRQKRCCLSPPRPPPLTINPLIHRKMRRGLAIRKLKWTNQRYLTRRESARIK